MPILDDGTVIQSGPRIVTPQYISSSDADDYFVTRLDSFDWYSASTTLKQAALITATRAIDCLNFVGVKWSHTQLLEFPRLRPVLVPPCGWPGPPVDRPPVVPQEILIACCEEAFVRLGGANAEFEIDALNVTNTFYANVRETYDRAIVTASTRAGILSKVAWNFLFPWLADADSISLCRVC